MHTEKYEVTVNLPSSHGGEPMKLVVNATNEGGAIIEATIALDKRGIERWSLKNIAKSRGANGSRAPRTADVAAVADCTCYFDCRADSNSGAWHQHEDEPCPVHPDAPMVG